MTLSGVTTPGLSGLGSNGNEGVLRIPQSSSIIGSSPSDCLVSYQGHSVEKRAVYSTAPAGWASGLMDNEMDWDIVVREFEIQFRYCSHFETNKHGGGRHEITYPSNYVLNSTSSFTKMILALNMPFNNETQTSRPYL